MKRVSLGIIIIAVLMLVGCNKVETFSQIDTTIGVEDNKLNSGNKTIEQQNQAGTPANNTKTYEDETHKEIQFGKLTFSIGSYHIVSETSGDNAQTFICEIDKGKGYTWTKPQMNITVRLIEKPNFLDMESIQSYIADMYPNYEKIKIYSNVTDDSGISNLYIITEGEMERYVVCYRDECYLIESDVDEIYLLESYPSEYYEVQNQRIECANSNITKVYVTTTYKENEFEKAEYDITQGKDGTKHFGELSRDMELQYHFTLKNDKGESLLKLSTNGDFYDVIKILDVNMDGYADIQFLDEAGALNNSYSLYVWDDSAKNFVKVNYDEMLSHFEVHDGYLKNWVKQDADSGVIQKLVWHKNTLIKESEEPYHAD